MHVRNYFGYFIGEKSAVIYGLCEECAGNGDSDRLLDRIAHRKTEPLSQWITRIQQRRGIHIATIALANKLARIAWAISVNRRTNCITSAAAQTHSQL